MKGAFALKHYRITAGFGKSPGMSRPRSDYYAPGTAAGSALSIPAQERGQKRPSYFYIVNANTFTYVPFHERETVRVLEDAAQRDVEHLNRKPHRDNTAGRLTGAPHNG